MLFLCKNSQLAELKKLFFYTLFIVVIQYHDRKDVFYIVPHSTDVGVWV